MLAHILIMGYCDTLLAMVFVNTLSHGSFTIQELERVKQELILHTRLQWLISSSLLQCVYFIVDHQINQ